MQPSRPDPAGTRRWHVPAGSLPATLPNGFRPLLLTLAAQHIELELRQPDVLVGRHTLVDLCLPYPDVSRKHCRFVFAGDSWHVVDMGSLNGIEINGERKAEADLHEGDTLRIANLKFEVHVEVCDTITMPPNPPVQPQPILRQIATTLSAPDRPAARKAS